MEYAVRRIGPIEGRPRATHDLDAVDVFVGYGDEVVHVDPERRYLGVAVVAQHEKGSRCGVAEPAGHHLMLGDAGGGDLHTGRRVRVVHRRERGPLLHLPRVDHADRCRGLERLFLCGARGCDDDGVELDGLT